LAALSLNNGKVHASTKIVRSTVLPKQPIKRSARDLNSGAQKNIPTKPTLKTSPVEEKEKATLAVT
jgi:hypothetical protein